MSSPSGGLPEEAPIVVDQPNDVDDDIRSRRSALGAGLGFAVVVATYGPSGLGDVGRWWPAGATVLIGALLPDVLFDIRRLLPTPGVAPLTLVAALLAVYLCVPETDQLAIAALLPVSLVGMELVGRRQMGLEWYAIAAVAVGWAGMFGATGRQSAFVGALFAWWAVALLPIIVAMRPVPSQAARLLIALVGAVAVVVMARTGGIGATALVALISVEVIAPISFGIAWLAAGPMRRESSRSNIS